MAKSVEEWIEALRDWDTRRRRAAAAALGEAGEGVPVEPLLRALGDADADVRAEAARALGRLGDPRAAGPLVEALGDPYPQVRSQAARALGRLRQPGMAEALVEGLPRQRGRTIQSFRWALEQLGEEARAPLRAGLQGADPALRQAVVETLGKLGARWAVPDLLPLLADGDGRVRQLTAEALGRIGDGRAVEKLLDCLHDPLPEVRRQAVLALGAIGDPRAGPELRKLLHPWSGEASSPLKAAVEEALARLEKARQAFTGRELMPAEAESLPPTEERSLVLVEPTAPADPLPTGRELAPTDGPME